MEKREFTVLACKRKTLARVNQMKGILQILQGESVSQDDTLNFLLDYWTQSQKPATTGMMLVPTAQPAAQIAAN